MLCACSGDPRTPCWGATFSAVGILVEVLSPLYPRYIETGAMEEAEAEPESESGLQAAYDYQLQNEEGEPFRYTSPTNEKPRL